VYHAPRPFAARFAFVNPELIPLSVVPKPGERPAVPRPHGSADALQLARMAQERRALASASEKPGPLVVICADAQDPERLKEEVLYFAPDTRAHVLPDWETLPYDTLSPHQDLVSERLETLHLILRGEADIVLVPAATSLYRLGPPAFIAGHTFFLKSGDKLDEAALRTQLTMAGYSNVQQVMSPGEWAARGSLIDLYPMGSSVPYRIDLFGNEIESIKTFDVDSQRSLYPVPNIRMLPGREFPMTEEARTAFRGRFREVFEGDPSRYAMYKDMGNGVAAAGIEYYLPLFFEELATLFDYLPRSSLLVLHGTVDKAFEDFWRETEDRYRFLKGDTERPLFAPTKLFLRGEEFFTGVQEFAAISMRAAGEGTATRPMPSIAVNRRAEDPLAALRAFFASFDGRALIAAESAGRRETMLEFFAEHGINPASCESFTDFLSARAPLMLGVAPLSSGFLLPEAGIAVITETELYAETAKSRAKREKKRESNVDGMLRDLSELKVGDPVVHSQHGIGRYLGLENIDLGEGMTEFLHLEYADGAKLYVPVAQLSVISRYSGAAPEDAPLHRLGSGQWEKAKRKAAQQVRDTAAELLNLYARRAARQGHSFQFKQHDFEAFAEGFGFEETADQANAIAAVAEDMKSGRPMDRLICGDVGFGKTEVALRAAFIAVAGGKQVALLAPTTLLVEQHFQTFSDRFADWPVKVAEISRFRNAKETAAALKGLSDGSIDIIIGTHKLLSKSTEFGNLGLVIIDEEHRFGVRQKEALKALRAEVDVLTLTATPIPRTLAMSLEGLRDFSVIATAPQKRLAIKTFVRKEGDSIIREAVLRELKRGGQVYFLYNEVETIQNMYDRLARILPEARIAIAHGQMGERELERVMRGFYQQKFNILLCTTIIETGIDVPTANTILMHRADKFGLAQLHQLRGRVGRSHHQAYAYLLVHSEEALTAQAKKRLEAIQMMEDLGSGFYLAMHDLEIRGAGEVLGESQSGEMQEIGFSLYTEMLAHAVACLKVGKEPDLSEPLGVTTEINLHAPALLPDDYCGDIHERLTLYKRLANCKTLDELNYLFEELVDRFGKLPEPAQVLIESHRLRITAQEAGVLKIDAGPENILIQFKKDAPIDAAKVIKLVQKNRNVQLSGQDRLKIVAKTQTPVERAQVARRTLGEVVDGLVTEMKGEARVQAAEQLTEQLLKKAAAPKVVKR
jgi:transcription-repair coupling factor (superfamily II helicase)